MTAADAKGTGEPAGAGGTPKGDGADGVHRDAERMEKWSIAWVMVALAMWGVLAVLMVSSYGPDASPWDSTSDPRCEGPLLAPFQQTSSVCHSELRQWPALLGFLALAVIPTIVAAAVTVYAKLLSRLATTLGGTRR
ncbi:hypothetical protein ACIQCF_34075 [Streptomyces sp. NPDC088353]|uniref:hypothetical protein n=1 Tax=unclassified Streptomyces TaxID=2593676 RepID=UPI00368836E0